MVNISTEGQTEVPLLLRIAEQTVIWGTAKGTAPLHPNASMTEVQLLFVIATNIQQIAAT